MYEACSVVVRQEHFESPRILYGLIFGSTYSSSRIPHFWQHNGNKNAIKSWVDVLIVNAKPENEMFGPLDELFTIFARVNNAISQNELILHKMCKHVWIR